LQTKRARASDTGQIAAPPIVHEVLRSPGQPLDPVTRAFMEPRFGYDFSEVRVHSDATAEQSARDVNAHAYTVGHDIVFGARRFVPDSHEGRRLIAHELTHVVQQSGTGGIRLDQGAVAASSIPTLPLRVQREALVKGEQVLPRVQVARDGANPKRLLLRYGDVVVATLEVRGEAADVNDIQVRDRTGARNQGQKIDTIDLDIVHPPGVTVTLKTSRPSLAKTKRQFGVLDVKVNPVEAKPPYGKDELQAWPPAHDLGTLQQRRPMSERERAEQERWRAEQRARDLDVGTQTAAAWKDYHILEGVLEHSGQSFDDLHDLGIATYLGLVPLPSIDMWNETSNAVKKELFLAAKALDQRYPGRARVHLHKADAALRAWNGKVWAAMKSGAENIETAERVTAKVGEVSLLVGETAANLIPGPVGKFLSFLYKVTKPAPKPLKEGASLEETREWMTAHSDWLESIMGGKPSGPGRRPSQKKSNPQVGKEGAKEAAKKARCYTTYLAQTAYCGETYTDDRIYDLCMANAWKNYIRCLNGLPPRPLVP
jgi:hypothetical protein